MREVRLPTGWGMYGLRHASDDDEGHVEVWVMREGASLTADELQTWPTHDTRDCIIGVSHDGVETALLDAIEKIEALK